MERDSRTLQARDYVSVEIKPDEDDNILVSSIKEKLEDISVSHCICKVPEKMRENNGEKYTPRLVSIGPLHHGKEHLKAMEDHKWRYLNTLLSRKPNLELILDKCVSALKGLENKVRKCYAENIDAFGSDDLVKMMLVDGCFIIELLLKYSFKGLKRRDDPFFSKKSEFLKLRSDVILLENQIPFFILRQLFDIVPIPKQCNQTLIHLALVFLHKAIPEEIKIDPGKFRQHCEHLLDLVHNCYAPTHPENHQVQQIQFPPKNLKPAMELRKAGIGFVRASAESLLDIKFAHGFLEIPPLKVNDYTETVLKNLLAMEQCYSDRTKYVTSYAFLMAKLIQTKKDVRLLYRSRILTNGLEKRQEILGLLKNLHLEVKDKEFYYWEVCEQVSGYRRTSCRIWWEMMKQRYRSTPWRIAGFVLAVLFLVLIFIGTLFSVLSFSRHHI